MCARNYLASIVEALSPEGPVLDTVAHSAYGRIGSEAGARPLWLCRDVYQSPHKVSAPPSAERMIPI